MGRARVPPRRRPLARSFLKQLAGDMVVYGLAGAVARSLSILLVPLYLGVLAPHDYGVIGIVDAASALLALAATLGLDSAAASWFLGVDDHEDRRRTIATWFWAQVLVGCGIAACLAAGSGGVARLWLSSEDRGRIVTLAALAIPPACVTMVLQNLLRFRRRARLLCAFNLVSACTTIAAVACAVIPLRAGVEGVYAARLVATLVAAAAALWLLRGWVSPAAFCPARLREMLGFGVPLLPVTFCVWTMTSFNRFVLQSSWTLHETGLYTVAGSFASVAALATGAFTQAWWPFAFAIRERPGARATYARVLDLYAFGACVMGSCLAVFALPLFRLLARDAYHGAATCVAWLVFAQLLEGARYIGWFGSAVARKSWPLTVAVGVGTLVDVAAAVWLVPRFGAEGAGAAVLSGYVACIGVLFGIGGRFTPIPFRWSTTAVCGLTAVAVVAADRAWLSQPGPFVVPLKIALVLAFVPVGFAVGVFRAAEGRDDATPGAGAAEPRQAA